MIKGSIVTHAKYGRGSVKEFYEFYNQIFVDVKFDDYEQTRYVLLDGLTLIKETINHD